MPTPSEILRRLALERGVDPREAQGLWRQESGGRTDTKLRGPTLSRGRGAAVGPFQVVPHYHPKFPVQGSFEDQAKYALDFWKSGGKSLMDRVKNYYGRGTPPPGHPTAEQYAAGVAAKGGLGQPEPSIAGGNQVMSQPQYGGYGQLQMDPQADPEMEALKRQRKMADYLRQMGERQRGPQYAGRVLTVGEGPLGKLASAAAGAYMDYKSDKKASELGSQRDQQAQEWMKSMPQEGDQQAMREWAITGTQIQHPLAKAVSAKVLGANLPNPAATAQANAEAQAAGYASDLKHQQALELENVRQQNRLGLQQARQAATGGAGPKLTAAEVKGQKESEAMINKIDKAWELADKNPDAFGLKNFLPEWMVQRFDEKGIDARAAVADIGSQIIHDRSGAAVTAAEFPRLRPFIPNATDTPEAVKKKLTGLRNTMVEQGLSWGSENISAEPAAGPPMTIPVSGSDAPSQIEPVPVKDKAAYDALPSGALYIAPDGTTKRKK